LHKGNLEQRTLLTVPILPASIHPENLFLSTNRSRSRRYLTGILTKLGWA
jgi:hypothetical protein